MSSQDEIVAQCEALKEMLLEKNAAYGDSALSPLRVFSRADNVQQIENRIDDKLSRLKRGHDLPDESRMDTIRDLAGYLILYQIALERRAKQVDAGALDPMTSPTTVGF